MALPLEDTVVDVVGKAQRGLRLEDATVLSRSGLSAAELAAVRAGKGDAALLGKIAPALELSAPALENLPHYAPAPVSLRGLAQFTTPFEDMTVNSYLAWDEASKEAVAFDTGADCSDLLALVQEKGLIVRAILLTHTHGDHIFDLDRLVEKTGAPACGPEGEPLDDVEPFAAGRVFTVGALKIETRRTSGHTPAGTTYVITGLERPVAVVGDALFAGSMGGAATTATSYREALDSNRREIFSLPAETVVCPGHGPLTTVGEETVHNPFFA